MTDKPSSNMLECDEADLDYLRNLLKERVLEVNVLRNTIRLIETIRNTEREAVRNVMQKAADERKRSAAKDSKLANQIEDHYDRCEEIDMETNKKYGQRELL